MKHLTRPGRLLLAVVLASVVTVDVVVLQSGSFALVLLAALLCAVLAAGAFSPFAGSHGFQVGLLGLQVVIAGLLAYRGDYVLAVILTVGSLATVQLLRNSRT